MSLSPDMTPRLYTANNEPVNARRFLDGFKAEIYHADREAISQGSHQHILSSPAHFVDEWSKAGKKETPLMRNGTMVHAGLFEPEVFNSYVVAPEFSGKGSVAAKADWLASVGDAKICNEDEKQLASEMVDAIGSHPKWAEITKGMKYEQTVYWTHKPSGVWSRARLDGVSVERRVLLDLKNTEDASERTFSRHIDDFGYHYQAAHYLEAANAAVNSEAFEDYIFCVCERGGHHAVKFYLLDQRALARGRALRENAYEILRGCIETNKWPSYEPIVKTIDLPTWAYASTTEGF